MRKIGIIYYVYLNPNRRWHELVSAQLEQLMRCGLLAEANLYVHVTGPAELTPLCSQIIKHLVPESKVQTSSENRFEYPGLLRLWELAQEDPSHIFLYFHSKGMSSDANRRVFAERALFQEVIEPWRKVMKIFETRPDINKVGFGAGNGGLFWFNFWWVRATYIAECVKPDICPNRWYYEGWLGSKKTGKPPSTEAECFSLAGNKSGLSYSVPEICDRINDVVVR